MIVFFVCRCSAGARGGRRYRGGGGVGSAVGDVLLWTAVNAAMNSGRGARRRLGRRRRRRRRRRLRRLRRRRRRLRRRRRERGLVDGDYLSEADHQRVSDAVAAAEARTAGEIVTVVADRSDGYSDIALAWAALVAFTALTCSRCFPTSTSAWSTALLGGWDHEWTPREMLRARRGGRDRSSSSACG